MKVSELAKKLDITSEAILAKLKSLRLKAVDGNQELNDAVISVIKSELIKTKKAADKEEEPKLKEPKPQPQKKTYKETAIKEEAPAKITAKSKKAIAPKPDREVKPKTLKAVKIPKVTEAKSKVVEKKIDAPAAEIFRPKIKISNEPVITLKPLVRKRKRGHLPDQFTAHPTSKDKAESLLGSLFPKSEQLPSSAIHSAEANAPATASEAIPKELTPEEIQLPSLEIRVPISVKDFSVKIQQKPSVILKQLMNMGVLVHINQLLDGDVVSKLAKDFGFNASKVKTQEEQIVADHKHEDEDPKLLKPRPPVITFMGHVDHGKTSLIDKIRSEHVADSEHGGITQHIGAYSVNIPKGLITFLDTPGHEAFTAMRARGAHITDIVVLVVAADEGIMPQTIEAINHARAANVPIVVALNKIDHRNANPDNVKKQLNELGLMPEDWGGKTVVVPVSALTGQGIDNLLDMILLEAELLELKANAQKKASGIVVEAHLSRGKGAVTSLIVQSGTLKEGDIIVVGPWYGKVKAMFDDHDRTIKEAGPSKPVEILGLSNVPEAGESFYVFEDEKQAREITARRQEQLKNKKLSSVQKLTLEDLYAQIQKGIIKELNVIIKGDVQGSLEALRDSLDKIPSEKIKLKFIHTGVGDVNASDVLLAVASKAIIIAFHVAIDPKAKSELEKQPVDVRQYRIIYDAVQDIKNALEGLLDPKLRKKFISRIEIRQVFKLSRSGIVAGCYVSKGKVHRKVKIDIIREDQIIYSGAISSLKRFKDDVREVLEGMECGITIDGFDKMQPGDMIEAYEVESIAQKL